MVQFDEQGAKLCLDAYITLEQLQQLESRAAATGDRTVNSAWNPEYGRYMLEGTPKHPYGHELEDFLSVEDNMRQR